MGFSPVTVDLLTFLWEQVIVPLKILSIQLQIRNNHTCSVACRFVGGCGSQCRRASEELEGAKHFMKWTRESGLRPGMS